MKKPTKLRSILPCITGVVLIGACATTSQTDVNYHYAETALRAAQSAGAEKYAPAEYATANETYFKARKLSLHKRSERAQKLLQLSVAQADLARAISEAELAEATLSQLQN